MEAHSQEETQGDIYRHVSTRWFSRDIRDALRMMHVYKTSQDLYSAFLDLAPFGDRNRHMQGVMYLSLMLLPSTGQVVSFCNVGLGVGDEGLPAVYGMGTYVEEGYRRRGLATKTWANVLKTIESYGTLVYEIHTTASSDDGEQFLRSLKWSGIGGVPVVVHPRL